MVPSKKSVLSSFSDAKPTRLLFYIFCRDLNTRSSSDAAKPRPLCRSQNDDNVLPPHNSAGEEKECDWKKSFWRESANGWLDGWISFFIKMDDVQNCFEMMKPNCRPQWGSKCLELWLVFASWLFWKANNQNLLTFCLLVRKQCDIKLHK